MTGSAANPLSILIIGGGPDGWLTALAAHQAVAGLPGASVRIVHEEGPVCAPALSAPPDLRMLHGRLGLNDGDILARTGGAARLGRLFSGWRGDGQPDFIQPHGAIGANWGPLHFHQQVAAHGPGTDDYANYALAAQAIKQARFAPPSPNPRDFLSTLDFGFHLDCAAYTALLRDTARQRGIEACPGRVTAIETDETGLAGVTLDKSRYLKADLYIDATGPEMKLAAAINAACEDWSDDTPFLFEATRLETPRSPLTPATRIIADPAGWHMAIALPDATVTRRFTATADDGDTARLTPGRLRTPWSGNCLAIGGAACRPDPLADADLPLLARTLLRLPGLLPTGPDMRAEADVHNRAFTRESDAARDFSALVLGSQTRSEPVWRACRDAAPSDRLAHATALFKARGRLATREHDIYRPGDWVTAWLGLGVKPRRHDPLADRLDPAVASARLTQIRTLAEQTAAAMPDHQAALSRLKAGVPPA
ncbi:tryptophan 7-halogenase [Maricaulis maris]|uniref:Tryptophan halogenase n=1 Tax=Maricaulis maris TaxID=74318 RepID=A0A495D5R3_9PROT|nr:tryptophan 7-halogenase [Maricaulis maris]RKQ96498.1 tryptophan halogenase [Maricaulis maris]